MENSTSKELPVHGLSWKAEEYAHRRKSPDWFWALGIIALAGGAAAVLVGNILFAVLIAIGTSVIIIYAARAPSIVTVTLTEKGVIVNNRLYPFTSIEYFSISHDSDPPSLILQLKNIMVPKVSILIRGVHHASVAEFLSEYLEEQEEEEKTLLEKLMTHIDF